MPPALTIDLASSSSPSSIDTFVTASATAAATPVDPAAVQPPQHVASQDAPLPVYHNARRLHDGLSDHCEIYLEENVGASPPAKLLPWHSRAYNTTAQYTLALLNSLIAPTDPHDAVPCPPPNQLSLLASLLVHPDFTTRAQEPSWQETCTESLSYLRDILHLVGPVNARFHRAFRFASTSKRTRTRSASPISDSESGFSKGGDRHSDDSPLSGRYACDSIWQRGQDFFNVVGWAFNCSVCHPNRWHYWKQWLEFMLDVLEADLHERHRLDQDPHGDAQNLLRESLLASYIDQRSSRPAGGLKFILKAIFADGSKSANSQFQEIWSREHKGLSQKAINKRKREAFNLDTGNFGGFLDNESVYSSQASEPPTPQKKRTLPGVDAKQGVQGLESTYFESVPLRQRLFSLVSLASL